MGTEKVVWLLGSGFSKPLGGPLLRDLFREEWEEDVAAFFPDDDYPGLAKSLPWVQKVFHNGVDYGLWENAEQFMAYVDDAYHGASSAPHRVQILNLVNRSHIGPSPTSDAELAAQTGYKDMLTGTFNLKVRRALAAECFRFTMGAVPRQDHRERWGPYINWVKTLEHGVDTVISFNYDRVVEMATEASGTGKITPYKPRDIPLEGQIPLLKLHGSVDWILKTAERGSNPEVFPSERILETPSDSIAIAAPGGSKAHYVQSYFEPLWKQAEAALKEASRLMIVGYSFPETDPNAQRLLTAFAGENLNNHQVHIVLGNDVNAPGVKRVVSLTKSTARGRSIAVTEDPMKLSYDDSRMLNIVPHPVFAQDFIGRHADFRNAFIDGVAS